MKKTLLLLMLGIMSMTQLFAKKLDGYFINKEMDTVNIDVNVPFKLTSSIPDFEKLQDKVKYFDKSTGKKGTLYPDEVLEIGFSFGNLEIKMLSRPYFSGISSDNHDGIFLHLLIDGPMKMFLRYESGMTPLGDSHSRTYYEEIYGFQREGEPVHWVEKSDFKKDMQAYFYDCPDLAVKIYKEEFQENKLRSIVEFYNSKCQ